MNGLIIPPPWARAKLQQIEIPSDAIDALDSDHALIDGSRRVAAMLVAKAQMGHSLSSNEIRLIQIGQGGILGRQAIEDAQSQTDALNRLLEAAEKRTWTHQELDGGIRDNTISEPER
jgi:hypothetical protein